MSREELAKALAKLHLAGVVKGYSVSLYICLPRDLGFETVATNMKRTDFGIYQYKRNPQIFDLDDPLQKAIVVETVDGHLHVYHGKVFARNGDEYPWFELLVFLGDISDVEN